MQGLGSSPFARHYLGSRFYFLLFRVLRCFSSPACLGQDYGFILPSRDMTPGGLPHSETCGSTLVGNYSHTIAASRVLLRLLAPRYPPKALCNLTYLVLVLGLPRDLAALWRTQLILAVFGTTKIW